MLSKNEVLSFIYRCGLAAQNIWKVVVWICGQLKIFGVYTFGILWPERKSLGIIIVLVCAVVALFHFIINPISNWMEDRAMMKNPIIAHSGENFLLDGKKVIKFEGEGRIEFSDATGGGTSIDTMYPLNEPGILIVCANSAFQNQCEHLAQQNTLTLIDLEGTYGEITYTSDKKGITFLLVKIFRPLKSLASSP